MSSRDESAVFPAVCLGKVEKSIHGSTLPRDRAFGNESTDSIFSSRYTSGLYKSYLILGVFNHLEYRFCCQLYVVGVAVPCSESLQTLSSRWALGKVHLLFDVLSQGAECVETEACAFRLFAPGLAEEIQIIWFLSRLLCWGT